MSGSYVFTQRRHEAEIAKDLQGRKDRERKKAVEKYGQEAADNPCGHPEKDVSDYALNELVGLERYAEMLFNRSKLIDEYQPNLAWCGRTLAREIKEKAAVLAADLAEYRFRLKQVGLLGGERER